MNPNEPLTQLGRYRLKRVIGRGAMGLVYEGLDPQLERAVAVKTILKSHMLDETVADEYSARFVREAQAAGRLNHPNIVTVFDFGQQDGVAYLVMEFICGRELAAHFEDNHHFDLPQAVRIMGELLDALGYAHERGIVHRDVKPANVMIETSGRVKLTDFGVARLAEANGDRTVPGTMVGTPSYMSPEQIQGLAVGSRTDLFAAGVVLYEFLTHQKPFAGGGQWTVQRKIVLDDPVWPSMANQAVPPVFDAIVQRALAKDPEDRYPTAAEFAADLRRALGTLPPSAVAAVPLALPDFDPDATLMRPSTRAPPATATPLAHSVAATVGSVPFSVSVPRPAPATVDMAAPVAAALDPKPSAQLAPAPSGVMPRRDPSAALAPAARSPSTWVWGGGALAATLLLGAVAWFVMYGASRSPMPTSPTADAPLSAHPAATEPPAVAPAIPTVVAPVAAPAIPAITAPVTAPTIPTVVAPATAPVVAKPAAVAHTSEPPAKGAALADPAANAPAAALVARPVVLPPPRTIAPHRAEARVAAPRPAAATPARCSDLLQRMQLGESLSPEGSLFFQKECR